jgi:SAM-dependent methyltransferase
MSAAVTAETHPPEYLLHRYWARKPSNVLAAYLRELVPPGGRVVDPFCGSGVFLSEAARGGIEAYGFDLNPVAVLLSRITLEPPSPEVFVAAADEIFDEFDAVCTKAFGTYEGATVRYVVHETVTSCGECQEACSASLASRAGRTYRCGNCGARVHLNLRHLETTRVREIVTEAGVICADAELREQERRSQRPLEGVRGSYSHPFAENRRILAHEGMETADLFTPRNFSLLSLIADRIDAERDPQLRDALLLLLSASVAQCSRLIAYRGRMTSGGPAWSVPGFWVPPVHVEVNPLIHLRGRLRKFARGFERLRGRPARAPARVEEGDASKALEGLAAEGARFDLAFFDPPYGDSVPYGEFSTLYNSFLGRTVELDEDISVSDRVGAGDPWDEYAARLKQALAGIRSVLAQDGKLLVTFNNHDDRAWSALFEALQHSGFRAESVRFQMPAVVPAKAQFAPEGSYIGDFYCVYERSGADHAPATSLEPVRLGLEDAAIARGGTIPAAAARRVVASICLAEDVAAELLPAAFGLIEEIFSSDSGRLELRATRSRPRPTLGSTVLEVARRQELVGSYSWSALCTEVAGETAALGVADPAELLAAAGGAIEVEGKSWRWSDPTTAAGTGSQQALELK